MKQWKQLEKEIKFHIRIDLKPTEEKNEFECDE